MISKAIEMATTAHEGQTRRFNGEPYINHPRRVAERVLVMKKAFNLPSDTQMNEQHDEVLAVSAWLHDVVEDTTVTLDQINDEFGSLVARTVDTLTRREDEEYVDFIIRCAGHPFAALVKLADLTDNMSDLKPGSMKDKYQLAYQLILTKISNT